MMNLSIPQAKSLLAPFFLALFLLGSSLVWGQANLSITKTGYHHGGNTRVNFMVIVTNSGNAAATNVTVTDQLSSDWTYTHGANDYRRTHGEVAWNSGTKTLSWTIPYIAPNGGTAVLIFNTDRTFLGWHTPPGNPHSNTAQILAPYAATSTATTIPLHQERNLSIAITPPTNMSPELEENVTFVLTASTVSGNNARARVTFKLPPGFEYVSTSGYGTYTPETGVWNIPEIGVNSGANTRVRSIIAKTKTTSATADGYKVAAALTEIVGSTPTYIETDISNNIATLTLTPQLASADLQVTKNVDNNTPTLGNNVVFTVQAKNNGPDTATNVNVTDLLPAGYEYVSHTVSSGTYTQGTGVWDIGNMANTVTQTLTITAKVVSGTNLTNTATILGGVTDPNNSNNTASASVTPVLPTADLGVSVVMSITQPTPGNNVTFTITAQNLGPDATLFAKVNSLLPSGFSYVSHSASVGTYNNGTGVWTIGSFANAVTATLTITAQMLASGSHTLSTTITHGGNDPVSGNNAQTVSPANVCGSCTQTLSASNNWTNITVPSGQTYCIPSGVSVSAFITVESGGTLCIAPGGTLAGGSLAVNAGGNVFVSVNGTISPVSINAGNLINGTITNYGTMNFSMNSGGTHAGTIENFKTFNPGGLINLTGSLINNTGATITTGQINNFAGTLTNHGTIENTGGTTFLAGGSFLNTGNYSTTQVSGLSGLLENHGTITNTGGTTFSTGASMINSGTYTSTTFHDFPGTLNNSGTLTISGTTEFLAGSEIINQGEIRLNGGLDPSTVNVTNHNLLIINSGVNVQGWYWNNLLGGEVYLNGTQITFIGDLDNSGYWEFERLQTLSSTLNNYGHMKVSNVVNSITSTTYLTNDDLLEFVNVSDVQYNGPMLTNNGTITVTHGTAGNFKMNQAINRMHNNGTVNITGQFELNNAGAELVNNCKIIVKTFFVGNGTVTNAGLIHAIGTGITYDRPDGINIEGTSSYLTNTRTGFVRGVNFRNSGDINGYGAFYFTGTTNMNTGGTFIGDSATEQILFFDTTQTGSNIFDSQGGTVTNVLRPASLTPQDSSSYNCTAPPSYAGSPPTVTPVSIGMCVPADTSFDIDDYVTPAEPVGGDPFVLLYSTIKLFEYNNPTNATNNSANLVIAGKGTFSANTTTGVITFTRHPSFISGTVEAEYRISNKRTGDPITYPSPRAKITITINTLGEITIEEGSSPLCIGETLTLSNPDADGVWESDNPAIATVDATTGVVTGVSAGQATISYTKYFENGDCEIEKTIQIDVESCEPCAEDPASGTALTSIVGISTLNNQPEGWPENIPNGYLVLQSKDKGFVITRVPNTNPGTIASPVEGMLVYDETDDCIKLYNGTIWNCIEPYCIE